MNSSHEGRLRNIGSAILAATICLVSTAALGDTGSVAGNIPFKSTSPADDNLIYRAIAVFLLAGLAVYAIVWCIKRYFPKLQIQTKNAKQLERLESMRLGPRSNLIRIRWNNQEILLGETEHSISLIATRELSTPPAPLNSSNE